MTTRVTVPVDRRSPRVFQDSSWMSVLRDGEWTISFDADEVRKHNEAILRRIMEYMRREWEIEAIRAQRPPTYG